MTKTWNEGGTCEVSTESVCRSAVELLCLRAGTPESRDRPAFSYMADGESISASLSFGQLDARARSIAAHLQAVCSPGDRALLVLPPGLDYIAAFFGCLYAGVIAVPALPPSSSRTLPRLEAIAADAQPRVVLSSAGVIDASVRGVANSALAEYRWVAVESLNGPAAAWREPDAGPDSIAFLQYTSGSTSLPKGVMVSHGNILANVALIRDAFDIDSGDVIVSWLPPHHDMGLIGKILVPLYAASHCIQMPASAFLARPLRWLRALSDHNAYITSAPNFAYDLCVDKLSDEDRRGLDLSALRFALNGAEPVRAGTLRRFSDAFAASGFAPGAITPVYGLAEATLYVTANVRNDRTQLPDSQSVNAQPDGRGHYVSVGLNGTPDHQVRIVDPASLSDCRDGDVGEVWVSGPSITQGYWQRPEETALVFHVAASGIRYLRTGDLGFSRGGALHITGRIKDLIIVGGRNIYPQDVEATVEALDSAFRAHGCAVFSIESEVGTEIVVVQEIERRKAADTRDLAERVCGELAEVHELFNVAHILLVRSGVVPRTSSGKIQRYRCRELFIAQALDPAWSWQRAQPATDNTARSEQAPSGVTERRVAAVWQQVLALTDIPASQSFFELGGQSLLAAQAVAKLNDEFDLAITLHDLFAAPTVSRLAARIDSLSVRNVKQDAPRIGPATGDSRLQLSFAQQRLWFLDRFEPCSARHNIPAAVRMTGALDVAALEHAFNELVSRHEALRTRFVVQDGTPRQLIVPALRIGLPIDDLAALPHDERERQLAARLKFDAARGFDLATGPLIRVALIRLDEREHVLMLTLHHIVSDGWSMGVLIEEIAALYRAFVNGEASPLAPLAIQYADYASWQRRALTDDVLAREGEYWKAQLADAPVLLTLPTDRPRPLVKRHQGALHRFTLPASIAAGVGVLTRRVQGTLFMALAAALNVLLSRYAGQTDISIGTFVANRQRAETYPLIGFFVNTVVLRNHVDPDLSFEALVARVRDGALQAFAHEELPFEQVLQAVQPPRQPGHSPLCQVMLVLLNAPMDAFSLPHLQIERLPTSNPAAHFDLSLTIEEGAGGVLQCGLEYDADLFEAATAERIARHFEQLLDAVVRQPHARVGELPMLSAAEHDQIVVQWNDTDTPYPREKTLHGLFEEQVRRTPDAVALVYEDAQLSYRELNARANRLARHLRTLGVGPDVLVGLCVERSLQMVVGLLAVLKAGGAYVPLDPSYPQERLSYMLADAKPAAIVTQASLIGQLETGNAAVFSFGRDDAQLAQAPDTNPAHRTLPQHLAYVIYTSGSTGRPKGIAIQRSAVANLALHQARELAARGCANILQFSSLNFDMSVEEIFPALVSGMTVTLCRDEIRTPGREFNAFIDRYRIDALNLPAAFWHEWTAFLAGNADAPLPRSVKWVAVGGERVDRRRLGMWQDLVHGQPRPPVWINAYGPSESTVNATLFKVSADTQVPGFEVPIGRPIANTQMYVLDARLNAVPVGVAGELYIAGEGLARGYLNRPELSAERFVPDPFGAPGARMYRSGDVARYLPDGNLEYLGRTDAQVKIRGFRIEPGEIEAALSALPQVKEVVVLAREDVAGEDRRLVAYVVPNIAVADAAEASEALDADLLRAALRETLPGYMVPSHYVMLDALPLTPNGKLDRRALPAPELAGNEATYVEPRSGTERELAAIWSQVLHVERVGIRDNFFELGGHSLLATQVVSKVRAVFGVELALRTLFEAASLGELAQRVVQAQRDEASAALPTIMPVVRDGAPLPLSFEQQRLWFLDRLEPGSAMYNIPVAIRLVGQLDVAALEMTLNEVVRRHEALRTHIVDVDGTPAQVVMPELKLALQRLDLGNRGAGTRESEAQRLLQQEASRPFDLSTGPLIRAGLLCLADDEYIVYLTLHHIVSDGWSMGVLVREVAALYAAFARGEASPLAALPVQYADYAHWQREWLQGEVLAGQLAYWKAQLADAPVLLTLPTDRPRPAVQRFAGASHGFTVDAATSAGLNALARESGATLFMVLAAAFSVLLARHAGQDDICVGTSVAKRDQPEVEPLIGFFVNTLVLRTRLAGNPSFGALLAQVRETALGAYAHQDVPFEQLVEELKPPRHLGHAPLFQVMLVLQNAPDEALRLPGLRLEEVRNANNGAKFDLTLLVEEHAGELRARLSYSTDLFEASTAQQLTQRYTRLLSGIVADPQARVSALPLLDEAERERVRSRWQAQPVAQEAQTLHGLFEAQAARTPDAVAVVFDGTTLSYGELDAAANRLAHYLRAQGVGAEARVALCLERSPEMVVALLGVLKAGGAYVPLDPAYPRERLAYMLADAAPAVLVTQQSLAQVLPATATPTLYVDTQADALAGWPASALAVKADAQQLAYVTYTSGSTGRPKGVMTRHASAVNYLRFVHREYGIGSGERVLQVPSLSFDASVRDILGCLSAGGRLRVMGEGEAKQAQALARYLREDAITAILSITPSFLEALVAHAGAGGRAVPQAYAALRLVLVSGEVLAPRVVQAVHETLGARVQVVNQYGPTECTMTSTFHRCTPGAVSIGRALDNVQAYVLDDALEPVMPGVAGELYLGGTGVSRGYLGQPALTAERFLPDPFKAGARLYRTGDRARWTVQGELEYLGRLDDQVKIRGFRVEPGEVEAALAGLAQVKEAAVLAREEEGEWSLVAYVVLAAAAAQESGTVREALQAVLPEYMVPQRVVVLAAMPLTPNGKLDRRALAGMEQEAGAAYEAPRTETEQTLADIWAQVLKRERVGAHDNFFELGGHSLRVLVVLSRVRKALGAELPLRALFEAPTVAEFAQRIETALGETGTTVQPALVPVERHWPLVLSFGQQRLWFLNQLEGLSAFYNMPAAVRLTGRLDVAALQRTLEALVARHEVLRTRFEAVDGTPVQVIEAQLRLDMPLVDLGELAREPREAEAHRLAQEEAQAPFDLARGPLIRARLLRLGDEEHVVLLTLHHIVSDGWSMGVLVREVAALYAAFARGEASPLAPLAVQYADYAHWQREWLQGEVLAGQLAYWKAQLADAPMLLTLPTDYARPAVQTHKGATLTTKLPGAQVDRLRNWARAHDGTLFMALLTVFKVVLSRWTGERDIVVGTVVAGRNHVAVEPLIGCFMNFLPIRSRSDTGETVSSLLGRLTQTVHTGYAHQECPFDQILEAVNPRRDPSHNPVFNVGFLLQNYPDEVLQLGDLQLDLLPEQRNASTLDLRMVAEEAPDGLRIECEYDTALFEASTVQSLLEAYAQAVEQVLDTPDMAVEALRLPASLDAQAARRRRPLEQWTVAATFTAEPVEQALSFWADRLGVNAEVRFAPYNQLVQTLLDAHSAFSTNRAGANVMLVRIEDWVREVEDSLPLQRRIERLDQAAEALLDAIGQSVQKMSVPLLVCVTPASTAFTSDPMLCLYAQVLQQRMLSRLKPMAGVYALTGEMLLKLYPVETVEDTYSDGLGHIPYTPALYTALGTLIARRLSGLRARPHKVIVLDCDNTLWKGVCGEVGATGIEIEDGHRALQSFMIAQQEAGMLLCLCSKNNEADVQAVFKQNADMVLNDSHLIATRINWSPKSQNLRALAQELNLGLDTFIFIDDSALECAEVREHCPEVLVLQAPAQAAGWSALLDHVWAFDRGDAGGTGGTGGSRTEQYRLNRAREAERAMSGSFEAFLAGLELRVRMGTVEDSELERVAELTARTNQFNANPQPRDASQLRAWREEDPKRAGLWSVHVEDRFGAYGLTGVVSYRIDANTLTVDTLLLSCRVLGRGVEHRIVQRLGEVAKAAGCEVLDIRFRDSGRNEPALTFLASVGDVKGDGYVVAAGRALAVTPTPASALAPDTGSASADAAASGNDAAEPTHSRAPRIDRTVEDAVERIGEIARELNTVGRIERAMQEAVRRTVRGTVAYEAPRTGTERAVADIWAQVLQLDHVGANDDFFDNGGHSLRATQVLAKLRQRLAIELPLRTLFAAPTVRALARHVDAASGEADAASRGRSQPPLVPLVRDGSRLPLSFAQQRLWFLNQLEGHSAFYNMPAAVRLIGRVDIDALQRTLEVIVDRHESLRTRFEEIDGTPVQMIDAQQEPAWQFDDLQALPQPAREAAVQRLAFEEARTPFDLAAGPLLRSRLVRLSEDEHIALLTMHHIVSDGWSMGVLMREVAELYAAFSARVEPVYSALPVQYADYAHWHREWLKGDVLDAQLAYWQAQLADAPVLLSLPTDRPRPAAQRHAGASFEFHVDAATTAGLNALARDTRSTLFMVLAAAFNVLLARHAAQDDICIGTPVANRTRSELEGLIGFFVNTLVLRTRLAGNPTFLSLLAQVRETALGAYAHQDVPFEQLVEALQPARSLSHSPLFQVMLVLQNAPQEALQLPDLRLEDMRNESDAAQFDLTLQVEERDDTMHARLNYDTDLFDAATAEQLMQRFTRLLAGIVARPHARIGALPMLDEVERQSALQRWVGPEFASEALQVLPRLFETQVALTPDATAVVSGDASLSYYKVDVAANRLAHYLRAQGVGAEVRVGLCLERSVDMVVALLAVLKAGGAYVPLDPAYPRERLAYMVEHSAPAVLITQQSLKDVIAQMRDSATLFIDTQTDLFANLPDTAPEVRIDPRHPAYVMYTSGSTGYPKGVCIAHGALANFLHALQSQLDPKPDDVMLGVTSLSFDIAALELFLPLTCGAQVIVASREAANDPEKLFALMAAHAVTSMQATPATWRMLSEHGWPQGRVLKRILTGGSALPADLAKALHPHADALWNLYGPTETTIWSSAQRVAASLSTVTAPLGQPIENTQIYILDAALEPVAQGVAGELYIGGDGLARGYLDRPDLTAASFVANPYGAPGSRMYRTGDLVRSQPDGAIEYLGRLDEQVKIRGFRIELGEIEAVLAAVPTVREAVVVAKGKDVSDRVLVAYVVLETGTAVTPLRESLQARLPSYMIPSHIVVLERMPLTPNGKVDRRALPEPERASATTDYVAPRTPTEQTIAEIWADVLHIERVSVHDDFFSLGGHSLLAAQAAAKLRRRFDTDLPLRALFEAPTPAALATHIDAAAQVGRSVAQQPPLQPTARDGRPLALSFAQQRLWLVHQLGEASAFYNIPVAVRLSGRLDIGALQRTFERVMQRHEVLRTHFEAIDGAPVQIVGDHACPDLPLVDVTAVPHAQRETQVRRLVEEEARTPFDLTHGPLLRVRVLRLSSDEHIVLLTMHHIVSDGWSMGVLVDELAALYEAFALGESPTVPPLPVQYADYAQWERSWLQGDLLDAQSAYWKQQLADAPLLLSLPTDRPRPPVQSHAGTSIEFHIDAPTTAGLNALARESRATLFMVLSAAFSLLLARHAAQDDISIGTSVARRDHPAVEGLIGLFVNTLVLRTRLAGNPTFVSLLAQVRETALGAYAHQDVPFEQLVEVLQPARSLSHAPLFQVMLVLQNAPRGALVLSDLRMEEIRNASDGAKFDLSLLVDEHADALRARLSYSTDLFDASTIERLIGRFERLLAGIVAQPDARISALPMLDAAEHEDVLRNWQGSVVKHEAGMTLHRMFEAQVSCAPDAQAVAFGDEVLSYRELDAAANRLAHYLLAQGVGAEVRVGLCLERSADMVVALLAVLKAGGAYVPLDPSYPRERLAYMLNDAAPAVLITQQSLKDGLPATSILTLCIDTDAPAFSGLPANAPSVMVDDRQLAYITYTSGSTGQPKGVMTRHASAVNYLRFLHREYRIDANERVLQVPSFSFDASVRDILGCLSAGGYLRVMRESEAKRADALAAYMRDDGITALLSITPSFLEALTAAASARKDGGALRLILVSGEVLAPRVVRSVHEALGSQVQVINQYGPTECTMTSTFHRANDESVRIGRALDNAQTYVLDDALEPVAVGVTGELYIGGAGLSSGYLGRPAMTAERFLPSPFGAGERLYRTGDRACWSAEGELVYLGRIDDQVKIRGFRVEPGEVEAVLSGLPEVNDAAVLAREEDGEWSLVAYVVPVERDASHVDTLREALQAALPDYMVPSRYVLLDAMPLTPNGKIDRRALPDIESQRAEPAFVAPRTPTEETLAAIWAQVLKLERVGIHDNFFDHGGHSLRVLVVLSRVRKGFGLELPMRALFEAPTVEALALRVDAALGAAEEQGKTGSASQVPALVPVERHGPLALSFAQQRLWFLNQLEGQSAFYNVPAAVRLTGRLDVAALQRTLEALVARHEVLRTRFEAVDGTPVQVIEAQLRLEMPLVDLGELAREPREAEAHRLAQQEAHVPFDLARGPLMRARLLRLGDEEHVVLLTLHHIVSDGWSMGVLVREVAALYAAFARGEASPLAALPVQYADYAHWQREWLQGEVLAGQLAYWKAQLADAPMLLTLPTDRPRPAVQRFAGASQDFTVDAATSAGLNALARESGATLFMVLAAAFSVLLARHAGQNDICVGTPVANRTRSEVEPLIGFFVNTLVLRTRLAGNPSFGALLAQVRETALGAYAHQDVPFEQLVEELKPPRHLGHSPLFQVMLVLQNAPAEALQLPGLTLEAVAHEQHSTKFDLTLTVVEREGEMQACLTYSTDLFDASTAQQLTQRFTRLLSGIVADPQTRISALPLLDEAEREQVLSQWQGQEVAYDSPVTLKGLFEAQVARTPDAPAVVFGDTTLSYGELDTAANRLAHYLRAQGVGAEERVALCLERSLEMVVALLGVLKAGGAYVPLDPAYPLERLAYMLADAAPAVLVTQQSLAQVLPATAIPTLYVDTQAQQLAALPGHAPALKVDAQQLAYVIYTSGSTGRPKGVGTPHAGIVNRLNWMQDAYDLDESDRVLQKTPFSFDVSVWEFFWPLTQGATLVVARPGGHQDPQYLAALIVSEAITTLHFVPPMLEAFLSATGAATQCASLRRVICSGQALPLELQKRFFAALPEVELHNLYGPTEASVDVTYWACEKSTELPVVPIGRPIANTQLYILDGALEPVPMGVAGELYIAGDGLARGYLGRPELTAAAFVANSFGAPGMRMYRTGDWVRGLSDGSIDYLGRLDDQVKIRGFRIELGEIEAALMALSPVREAVAVARDADGAAERVLVAYVVLAPAEPDASDRIRAVDVETRALREALQATLPAYMVPQHLVVLEYLPLTPNGKVDRRALPAPDVSAAVATYEAPHTATEQAVGDIWAEVLKLERVGVHDNFFELGGHSLLALTVVDRIRARGMSVDVRALFESPTLAALARELDMRDTGDDVMVPPNLIPSDCDMITPDMLPLVTLTEDELAQIAGLSGGFANVQDIYPLAPLQEGILFHHLMSADGDAYLLSRVLHFDNRERLNGFVRALQAVIDRHDILRTAIHWEGLNEPVQVVWREAPIVIEEVVRDEPASHTGAGDGQQPTALRDPRQYRIDVRCAPLLHGFIAQDEARGGWLLQIISHHLASDHTTLDLIIQEIHMILQGRGDGLPVPHPFRNFVARVKRGIGVAEHEAFFREWLADVTQPTTPFGLVDVQGDGRDVEEAVRAVEPLLADRARQIARKLKTSVASLIHVAWAHVLAQATGQHDVVFGTVLSGRMQSGPGGNSTLGMFINTLPVRIGTGAMPVEQSVATTQALLTRLLRHENASLALAQHCSGIAGPGPLFSTLLNYRHSRSAVDAVVADASGSGDGWEGVSVLSTEERTNYPCVMSVDDFGDGFAFNAQICGPIAAARVCDYMHAALEHLVVALEEAPHARLVSVELIDTDERAGVEPSVGHPEHGMPGSGSGVGSSDNARAQVAGVEPDEAAGGALHQGSAASGAALLTTLQAPNAVHATHDYVAPRTATERAVAQIWSEVLEVERVGIHDNFFELGGHSLGVMQVMSKVRSTFELKLALRALFEAPTLAAFAERVDSQIQNSEEIEI